MQTCRNQQFIGINVERDHLHVIVVVVETLYRKSELAPHISYISLQFACVHWLLQRQSLMYLNAKSPSAEFIMLHLRHAPL